MAGGAKGQTGLVETNAVQRCGTLTAYTAAELAAGIAMLLRNTVEGELAPLRTPQPGRAQPPEFDSDKLRRAIEERDAEAAGNKQDDEG